MGQRIEATDEATDGATNGATDLENGFSGKSAPHWQGNTAGTEDFRGNRAKAKRPRAMESMGGDGG